ncbi:MAG: PIN domain-containing protein [Bacteroidota bacterium]
MGIKDKLINKTVFIDTAPLIYFIEGHSKYQDQLLEIFQANKQGQINFVTSTLTLLEVLVQPIRLKRQDLVDKYEQILTTSPNIDIYDIDIETSMRAAQIRADYHLRTPDSIQIATGIVNGATMFLTNDSELKRVTEIEVLTLSKNKT